MDENKKTPKRKKMTPEEKANKKRGYRLNDIEKAGIIALLDSGKGVRQVARETGRPPSTISRVSRGKSVSIVPEHVEHIKKNLSVKLYKRADEAVNLMGDGRLNDMSAFQLAGITKHNVETARLLDNESTANFGINAYMQHLAVNPEDLHRVLEAILAQRKAELFGEEGEV
jgi:hypothetical protein